MNTPIAQSERCTHVRWVIATTLFVVTAVNFADRATLSITASSITKQYTAGITTPIIIGYIVNTTGSFNGPLVFVGANALLAIVAYLFIVPRIKRLELARPTS